MDAERHPKLGDQVIFYDDDKCPHAAIVARVYGQELFKFRPRVCLSWLGYDGRWKQQTHVSSALHNGELWELVCRWAFPGEVPDEDCNVANG
jgi:hypothetical protein